MRHLLHGSIYAIALCTTTAAYAQETTSSIRGRVESSGASVAGATVTVIHVPSGTTATTVSNSDGSFAASGLRVGGPFTVKIVADGYVSTTITDIRLAAGQPFALPVQLESTGEDIVVQAASVKGVVDTSGGPATVIGRQQIENVASVARDIRDIVRRDPFATIDPGQSRGVMIAGQNARLNKFSVDGLRFSDNFGLNVGGLPTARGPVPLDAIEQMSVKVAPYDIQEGDFQGGAINVVLRSGTNEFHGSAFATYTNEGLTGKKTQVIAGTPTGRINLDFESRTYGAFLSGPIIKDKLFFAVSWEHLKEDNPIQIGTEGFPTVVPNLTAAQVANVASLAQSVYGYSAGGAQPSTLETDDKITVKLDWNITEGQRLAFTYIRNDSGNSSTAGFSNASTSTPALGLESNNYQRPEKVDSYVAQLNSDWSDNFHTEIRGNFRKYDLSPVPFGATPFSQMQVCLDGTSNTGSTGGGTTGCTPGVASIYFGPDRFRHFNYVRTKQYGTDVTVRWDYKDFSMKVNAAWSHLDVANAFTTDAWGTYYFDSLADFQAGRASSLTLGGSITGDLNDVLASFKYDQYTISGQTSWDPKPNFNITAGLRFDTYGGLTPPPLNTAFLGRYGFANTAGINGKYIFQPRLSGRWDPIDDLHIRAGIGLFGGGSPDVFLGNSYSVAGVYGNSISIQRAADGGCGTTPANVCTAALDNVNGRTFSSVVTDYLRNNTGSLALANVNAMDPKYHMESTWKSSLSVDYAPRDFLGGGWSFGGDLYYGWVNWAPLYKDLRLAQVGTMPDGRPRYATITTGANTDLLLTNTRKGHSFVAVARFDKQVSNSFTLGASYTFQDVKDVSSMNGTTASGTYGQNAMVDPNIAAYGTSIYQIRHSWKFHADFEEEFFGDNKTHISLFGELRSGIPYSLTMNDPSLVNSHSIFGTAGSANRYLLYVPTLNDTRVVYDSVATQNALNAFIAANGLEKYRGTILPKNTQRAPNWFKVDLHLDQDIPLPYKGMKVNFFADFENVLNLINKDWGALKQVAFPYLAQVVNVSCAATSGGNCTQYRYSNFANPAVNNLGKVSLWSIRIGARVKF
ncbi:MAG: carboxypeptidase regulatory-like domain-containing protein [Sphingobium sp.]